MVAIYNGSLGFLHYVQSLRVNWKIKSILLYCLFFAVLFQFYMFYGVMADTGVLLTSLIILSKFTTIAATEED